VWLKYRGSWGKLWGNRWREFPPKLPYVGWGAVTCNRWSKPQVGLSSVLSLPSFSLYRPALCVCVERERVLVVHTHLSLHTSCCSITGTWILFIMALRSCFLLHSIGLARKPAYVLSSRNDRLLFVQDYTHAYRRLTGRSFVFFFINYISTFHFALPYI